LLRGARAERRICRKAFHRVRDRCYRVRVKAQDRIPREGIEYRDSRTGGRDSGGHGLKERQAKSFEKAGRDECMGTFEQCEKLRSRNPAGKFNRLSEVQFASEVFNPARGKAFQPGDNEPVFRARFPETLECLEQAFEILMRMKSGNG